MPSDPHTTPAPDPFRLDGKTILVTGASSGIGQAVAIECAAAGAQVLITGRDTARLAATHAALQGGPHRIVAAELRDAGQRAALLAACDALDGVVFAAGISVRTPARMLRPAMLDEVMEANFTVPVLLTQQLLFNKILRNGASLVFLSSIAARTGTVGVAPYAASKAALEGYLRCLALEVAPRAMRANALAPAVVETPLTQTDPALLEAQRSQYPLGLGQPRDVALAALFLLADASRKVTGTHLDLDGGLTWT